MHCRNPSNEVRAMSIDDIIREEVEAEQSIRAILVDLQNRTGRLVGWVKVDVRHDMEVTVNTVGK